MLCATVVTLPQSKPLISGQQVSQWFEEIIAETCASAELSHQLITTVKCRPKRLLVGAPNAIQAEQGTQLRNLPQQRFLTTEISLGSYCTCHIKQLPRACGSNKNGILFPPFLIFPHPRTCQKILTKKNYCA